MPEINKLVLNKQTIAKTAILITPIITEIELDDESIKDEDISIFTELFPKNSQIHKIRISSHNMTEKSFQTLLKFIQSHSEITFFWFKFTFPLISMLGSQYNSAINRVLEKNKKLFVDKTTHQSPTLQKNTSCLDELPQVVTFFTNVKEASEASSSNNSSVASSATSSNTNSPKLPHKS